MLIQTQMEFPVHIQQNNAGSQAIMDANVQHLKGQCQVVLQQLQSGKRLTTTEALAYGIGDLRARIRDLISAGVPVQKKIIKGRFKEYFL